MRKGLLDRHPGTLGPLTEPYNRWTEIERYNIKMLQE